MRPQQIAWLPTKQEAVTLEAKLLEQAKATGQSCEKWAEVIEDVVLGFGVPVKDRVKGALDATESAKVADWTPPERVKP